MHAYVSNQSNDTYILSLKEKTRSHATSLLIAACKNIYCPRRWYSVIQELAGLWEKNTANLTELVGRLRTCITATVTRWMHAVRWVQTMDVVHAMHWCMHKKHEKCPHLWFCTRGMCPQPPGFFSSYYSMLVDSLLLVAMQNYAQRAKPSSSKYKRQTEPSRHPCRAWSRWILQCTCPTGPTARRSHLRMDGEWPC